MAMKAYKSYKNVDLPWLKRVPEHWEIATVNTLFFNNEEKNEKCTVTAAYQFKFGKIVKKPNFELTNDLIETYKNYALVRPNDIMINGLNLNYDFVTQRVGIVQEPGIITSSYISIRPYIHTNAKLYTYLFKAWDAQKVFNGMGTGIRRTLSWKELKQVTIPVPPKEEQDQIVRYLDWQNSRLNKLINAKKKEIALLEEQKQALISQAVTKGLDPNAPLKDSGIDYIGYIPKHWRVLQNRRLYSSVSRKYSDKQLVLSLSQKDGLIPYENMSERSLHTSSYDNWKLVLENDLVLNRFKAHLGVFFASDYNGIVTFHYGVYEPKFPIISKFYEALYHTESYKCAYAGQSRGMTVGLQNLSDTDFYSIYTVYPPYKEQIKISNYIKRLEYSFSKYREQLTQYISLLQEYRTRLVADVVTGQIDVRNIAIPNYETVTETIDQPETDENENNIVEK